MLAVVALLVSCSNKSSIVGRWQQDNGPYALEFFKDGTFGFGDNAMSFDGKYSFVDDTHMKMEFSGGFHTLGGQIAVSPSPDAGLKATLSSGLLSMQPPSTNTTVSISGGELSLTDEHDKILKYKRAN